MKSPKQFDIYIVNLDPTLGYEIQKSRPCVIVSPDEMNRHIRTVIIAPMTTTQKNYPTRVNITFQEKGGQIVLDQIRTVDKSRLIQKIGTLPKKTTTQVLDVLLEMFSYD